MVESVRIPKNRVAVLIGQRGKTKKELEQQTHTRLRVDSYDGEIEITGQTDPAGFYLALNIVKAIGRGFSPNHALLLLNENYGFEIISLDEWFEGKKSQIAAKRGRIIGRSGKAREEIENATDCYISVQGNTIAIIGPYDKIGLAKKVVEKLLSGARHSKVFEYISQQKKFDNFRF